MTDRGTAASESRSHFRRRVDQALQDIPLQEALKDAMVGLRDRRTAAFESFDFERGRADLMRRRGANLERIPELLDQFRTRLEGAGGV
ncbi:MAG: hypothetical protein ACRENM_06475, partial [Candidatus Dormibacteraceae bacterium]